MEAPASGPAPLDGRRLAALVTGGRWQRVGVVEQTGSTNADLAAAARAGAPDGIVLATGYQSGGRGRLNRRWTAPPGTSLALSMLLRPGPGTLARWSWLPLLTGLAVAESLRRAAEVPALLKWPNDVLVGDRKLCGILAERIDTPTGPACVIGVGINTDLTEEQLPVPWATSLALLGARTRDQTVVAATVLRAFELLYAEWLDAPAARRDGSAAAVDAAFAAAYLNRCSTVGREVRVVLGPDESVTGRAEAIDADGRLVVRTPTGTRAFSAGDVVHLR
ncbi:BirA family biotin operon repressor/biotin-[acetyl-CoA-carboxylase] ligase [Friedmanniella endophytica]|uniref:biotin--[biotin carboxyl-carrier protein] ligase n=1 Tax=Microlunatus kandeliicorticis TaxID=1759536 RepID=A0A7W3IQH7_9ACTN|nr:biotin--[acetyl-CoA-carboxylase] ligase [Microlunatus kandeliicorticis]MBA8793340.1 BirA family biotin operon repressor/biotin-[acetyl-CoA-carboxylase] ligase [Microlunatus kandeliicorticis]